MRSFVLAVLALALVSCRPSPVLTPFQAAAPTTRLVHLRLDTPLPTRTPNPYFVTFTPSLMLSTPAPLTTETLTATISASSDGTVPTWTPLPTWTPPPADTGAQLPARFLLEWPIANSGAHTLSRVYPYGSTYNGVLQVHHGVDLVNPLGTPLFTAADGTVLYSGNDFTTLFGPENNYYGNLVVIQHNFLSPERLAVFTLYGHMQQVSVQTGQSLRQGDVIGTVGDSGIARGPHVHFEVRVGNPYDFAATRNPELWLRPFPGFGVLAGRVTDADGVPISGVTLAVQANQTIRNAYTYVDDSVNPDPMLAENFTLGDLEPGYYTVTVRLNGLERFARSVYVQPDQLTWLDAVLGE